MTVAGSGGWEGEDFARNQQVTRSHQRPSVRSNGVLARQAEIGGSRTPANVVAMSLESVLAEFADAALLIDKAGKILVHAARWGLTSTCSHCEGTVPGARWISA